VPIQPPSFGFVDRKLSSEEIFQVWGLPVRIWRDPILFLFEGQGLFLDGPGCLGCGRGYLGLGRGYLGLGRGFLGLGRVVDLDRWLMQVSGEDVRGNRRSPRSYFRQLVRSLVVPSGDVVELQPVELVFQAPDFIAVGFHHPVTEVGVLHDLVNDKLRVASSVEASDP
jgi:hypothetical protein